MLIPRSHMGLSLLPDGRVLFIGGGAETEEVLTGEANRITQQTEIYDPVNDLFELSGSLKSKGLIVTDPSAIPLDNGKILILVSIERQATIYDPLTKTFSPVQEMQKSRIRPIVTKLQNGNVFIMGGENLNGNDLPSVEIFDTKTESFHLVNNPTKMHDASNATVLSNGQVLIIGDAKNVFEPWWNSHVECLKTTELFDPESETFSLSANTKAPHWTGKVFSLNNGKAIVVGGLSSPHVFNRQAELYVLSK